MNILKKFINIFTKHMALIVLIVACISLFIPKYALWIKTSYINYLLMVIMFGMGLILKPKDFILIFSKPVDILTGSIAQYTIMPLLALLLCRLFHLDAALTAGVILVGTCPGGTSSNVITYLSKGDVALSVCMTSVNTLLAPVLTPIITYLLLRTTVEINLTAMFFDIVKIVLIPIILGLIVNKLFEKQTTKITEILPVISVTAICLIVGSVVSHNAEKIFTYGLIIFAVVILHNLLGYLSGFLIAKVLKMDIAKTKAMSVEIGMQNSGLSIGLAANAFPSLSAATVPGAIFSVWHNISGAILAGILRRWEENKKDKN